MVFHLDNNNQLMEDLQTSKKPLKFYLAEPETEVENPESWKVRQLEQEKNKAGYYQLSFFVKKEMTIKAS